MPITRQKLSFSQSEWDDSCPATCNDRRTKSNGDNYITFVFTFVISICYAIGDKKNSMIQKDGLNFVGLYFLRAKNLVLQSSHFALN